MLKKLNNKRTIEIILLISLIFVTINSLIYFHDKYISGDRFIFYDLPLNYCAGKLFSNNISPYGFGLGKAPLTQCVNNVINGDWGMPVYIYSPIFLNFLTLLTKFDFDTIKNSWYFITLISIFLIIFFSYKVLPINSLRKLMPLIIFFSFGAILSNALFTGNISILGYGLVSLSLIFLHQKKLILFSSIIIFLSLIKPHFFIFLLIGFIVYEKEFIKYIFFSFIFFFLSYFSFFILETKIFIDFFNSIKAVNTKEWFFSFNSTFGLNGILNNLPTIFNNINLNIYFTGGPNIINNIIWLFLAFFIFIGSIYFRIITKVTNLNSQNKSKLIAFGSILILLMNPNVTIYDFLIFVPSIFYLINKIKFKNKYLSEYQLKYSLMIIFILVQDINFPFFISSFIYFIVLLSTFRNYDILELTKK